MLPWKRPTPLPEPLPAPDAEMVLLCPPLPLVGAPKASERLEEQVAAWQAWSLSVVRKYTECAKRVDLWKEWYKGIEPRK